MTPDHERVFLRQHPLRWRRLPIDIRIGLRKKRDEIVEIRAGIAQRAKVHVMPPVNVFDVAWVIPDLARCISGASGIVAVDGKPHLGVLLAGASVLFADEAALRGMLLHEFSHCFWNLQQALLAHAARQATCELDLHLSEEKRLDSAADRERMVRPEDWFAPEDCAIFPYHDSELLQTCVDQVDTNWVAKGLPCLPPPGEFRAEHPLYDKDVAAHIRELGLRGRI